MTLSIIFLIIAILGICFIGYYRCQQKRKYQEKRQKLVDEFTKVLVSKDRIKCMMFSLSELGMVTSDESLMWNILHSYDVARSFHDRRN